MTSEVAAPAKLTRKQRRAMGITIKNMRLKVRELKEAGELEGLTNEELSAEVMGQLLSENPKAFASAEEVGIDMDGILAFIERLMPLILMLMQLFG